MNKKGCKNVKKCKNPTPINIQLRRSVENIPSTFRVNYLALGHMEFGKSIAHMALFYWRFSLLRAYSRK